MFLLVTLHIHYITLVNENYKEPINGNFEDCTKDVLGDLLEDTDSDSDEANDS